MASSTQKRRPSSALIVAVVALVMATTGSAVAASLITSKQIKDGTIQTSDISKRALASLKAPAGGAAVTGPAGPAGAVGPAGSKGDKGDARIPGAVGPSDAYSVGNASDSGSHPPLTLNLPEGNYVAFAKYSVFWPTAASANALCTLRDIAGHMVCLFASVEHTQVAQGSASGTIPVHLTSAGSVTLTCGGTNATLG